MNLDEAAVGRLLRMEEVIPAMEGALADFSSGRVVQPVRVMLPVLEHQGFLGLMPAYTGKALGTKLVAFYPHNTEVPTHHATILLFKPETGEPLATLDGRLITEMRTAAVSAVATGHLARSEASVLAIIGSGVQARSHLEALRLVRTFREVRVWSPRRAKAFAEEHGVRASASAEEAALKESGDVIAAGEIFAEIGEVVAGMKPGRRSEDVATANLVYRRALDGPIAENGPAGLESWNRAPYSPKWAEGAFSKVRP